MSAAAASLRTRRCVFTSSWYVRGGREPGPCDEFRRRSVLFWDPWRRRRGWLRDRRAGALCLAESVRGRTRWAFPSLRRQPGPRRILLGLRGARCSTRSWAWLHNMTVCEGEQGTRPWKEDRSQNPKMHAVVESHVSKTAKRGAPRFWFFARNPTFRRPRRVGTRILSSTSCDSIRSV